MLQFKSEDARYACCTISVENRMVLWLFHVLNWGRLQTPSCSTSIWCFNLLLFSISCVEVLVRCFMRVRIHLQIPRMKTTFAAVCLCWYTNFSTSSKCKNASCYISSWFIKAQIKNADEKQADRNPASSHGFSGSLNWTEPSWCWI